MSVVWVLLGVVIAWPVVGVLIGVVATKWKGLPVAGHYDPDRTIARPLSTKP